MLTFKPVQVVYRAQTLCQGVYCPTPIVSPHGRGPLLRPQKSSPLLSLRVGTLVSKQGVEAAFRLGMEGKCEVPDSYSRPLAQVE